MIEVIDDVLDENTFKLIYEMLTKHDFAWRWAPGTIDKDLPMSSDADTPQFVRPIMMDEYDKNTAENDIINRWPEFYDIAVKALEKSERKWVFETLKFHRIKANLLTPWPNAPRFHPPHTDTDAKNAVSCIFYLHDSDGDTFFFGEENITVTPKANRAVLFDAHHDHCSSNPINTDRRMIINSVAFVDEEK
jgi:hypothetical protein